MKSMSFTVYSYDATVLLIQPNPTQPMDGPNPCPSLGAVHAYITAVYGHINCIYRRSGKRGRMKVGRGRGEKRGREKDGGERKCKEAKVNNNNNNSNSHDNVYGAVIR